MGRLRHLSVRHSMALFIGIATAGTLAQAGLSWSQSAESERVSGSLHEAVLAARAAGVVDMNHDALRSITYEASLAAQNASPQEVRAIRDELQEARRDMLEALQAVSDHSADGSVRTAVQDVKPVVEHYAVLASQLVESELTRRSGIEQERREFDAQFQALVPKLENLSGKVTAESEAIAAAREALVDRTRWMTPVFAFLTIGLLLGLSLPFVRRLLAQLGAEPAALRDFALEISHGNLEAQLATDAGRSGSAARGVAGAMLTMRDHLKGAVQTIRGGAGQVASGSMQMRTDSARLAERTDHQAAQLQQASASVQQMESAVKQTADNAKCARDLVAEAAAVAADSGETTRRAVDTMSAIDASSRKITEIVSVIDGIAFQTNILALNAAVEAARAGEQGRGFAVVAGEVRTLAQRSATAAREIKVLIEDSTQRVSEGHRIVTEAGERMERLVTSVQRVNSLIGDISESAREQAAGISELSESVAGIDQLTQQNATMVGDSANAASTLEQEAQALQHAVSHFRMAA